MSYTPTRGALAGKTFATKQDYRKAYAKSKGFSSPWDYRHAQARSKGFGKTSRAPAQQRRKRANKITSKAAYDSRTRKEQESFRRSLEAKRYFTEGEGKVTMQEAARRAGTTVQTMTRYGVVNKVGNKLTVTKADKLYRPMLIFDADTKQPMVVSTTSQSQASMIGRYHNAIKSALTHNTASPLLPFRGKQVNGITLLTDLESLKQLESAGAMDTDIGSAQEITNV